MKLVAAIVLLVIGHLGLGTAYADSDGYYCIGRGYLAYQFGLAAPPTRPHRLTVIRFGDVSGIQPPAVLELPQSRRAVSGLHRRDRSDSRCKQADGTLKSRHW